MMTMSLLAILVQIMKQNSQNIYQITQIQDEMLQHSAALSFTAAFCAIAAPSGKLHSTFTSCFVKQIWFLKFVYILTALFRYNVS
jgi:hypothetical protein